MKKKKNKKKKNNKKKKLNELFKLAIWTGLFSVSGESGLVYFPIISLTEIQVYLTNSVNPDQVPRSVACNLDLHCIVSLFETLGNY